MKTLTMIGMASVLALSACGGGSSGGGSSAPVKSVAENLTGVSITGQVDLDGAVFEAPATAPTVEVNGNVATVTATADPDVFDWTVTFASGVTYTDYRVEYFANGNLIGAVDYSVDP